jgi:hypothetical protein
MQPIADGEAVARAARAYFRRPGFMQPAHADSAENIFSHGGRRYVVFHNGRNSALAAYVVGERRVTRIDLDALPRPIRKLFEH